MASEGQITTYKTEGGAVFGNLSSNGDINIGKFCIFCQGG
jgi:hypothetical protein